MTIRTFKNISSHHQFLVGFGQVFFVFLVTAMLQGCYYDNEEELYGPGPACDTTANVYNGKIKLLIDTNCAISGCHGNGAANPLLTTYAQVKAKIDDGTFKNRVIDLKNMPPPSQSPLSACELQLISTWVAKGAPEN